MEILCALKAFKKEQSLNKNGNYDLPGLNMTQDQLFFLKFAQSWCQLMTNEGIVDALKTWRHSLGRFRLVSFL